MKLMSYDLYIYKFGLKFFLDGFLHVFYHTSVFLSPFHYEDAKDMENSSIKDV